MNKKLFNIINKLELPQKDRNNFISNIKSESGSSSQTNIVTLDEDTSSYLYDKFNDTISENLTQTDAESILNYFTTLDVNKIYKCNFKIDNTIINIFYFYFISFIYQENEKTALIDTSFGTIYIRVYDKGYIFGLFSNLINTSNNKFYTFPKSVDLINEDTSVEELTTILGDNFIKSFDRDTIYVSPGGYNNDGGIIRSYSSYYLKVERHIQNMGNSFMIIYTYNKKIIIDFDLQYKITGYNIDTINYIQ